MDCFSEHTKFRIGRKAAESMSKMVENPSKPVDLVGSRWQFKLQDYHGIQWYHVFTSSYGSQALQRGVTGVGPFCATGRPLGAFRSDSSYGPHVCYDVCSCLFMVIHGQDAPSLHHFELELMLHGKWGGD